MNTALAGIATYHFAIYVIFFCTAMYMIAKGKI